MADEPQEQKGGAVALRERYLIHPGQPQPYYNNGDALAFRATDRRNAERPLFALVVRPGYPARTSVMRMIKELDSPGLMKLIEWGVVDWPPAKRRVMVVVYEKPGGGRLCEDLAKEFTKLSEHELVKKAVMPLVQTLRDLRSRGINHRAIRPTNMYWASPAKDRIILGDCVTAPPGVYQPVIFETIESSMADPMGRGEGYPSDDYYALGVSLLFLILGRNPWRKVDDDTMVRQKIYVGTFGVLVGEQRFGLQTIELMRGLLFDDPDQRWTGDDVDLWENGKRASPLMVKGERRAARAMVVGGKECFFSRDLAYNLARNWEQGKALAADGKIELWIRRSLDQKEKATSVANAVDMTQMPGDRKMSNDALLAKVCLILDPLGPIRYKDLSLMPGGVGSFLAMTLIEGKDVRSVAEMLLREIPRLWLETRSGYNPDNVAFDSRFRAMRNYLERGSIGFGMERVLYEANDSMPCLSPLIINEYVMEARDILPALEKAAENPPERGWPIDRHIAAFIYARAAFDVDAMIAQLSEPRQSVAILSMINLLASMQWRFGHAGTPHLSKWVAKFLPPVVISYHNRDVKKRIEKELPGVIREGSLVELARLVDNPEERLRDAEGFEAARREWDDAEAEIQQIAEGDEVVDEDMVATARQVAALVSVGIALATVALLLLHRVL